MSAWARPDTSVSARKKTSIAIAERTPMSRTRPARRPNSSASSAGSAEQLDERRARAPRSARSSATSSPRCARPPRARARRPWRRPGGPGCTNTGSSTRASSVICHDRPTITASVSTRAMTLVTTPDSAEVNARWAPITSLFSRLTSAPVWVRVKNAIGMRCTCSNTARRRSRMRPSPRRDDCSRSSSPTTASSHGDRRDGDGRGRRRCRSPVRRRWRRPPARRGPAWPRRAPRRPWRATRKTTIVRRCGRANAADPAERLAAHRPPAAAVLLHGALQRHPHAEVGHGVGSSSSTRRIRGTVRPLPNSRSRPSRRGRHGCQDLP